MLLRSIAHVVIKHGAQLGFKALGVGFLGKAVVEIWDHWDKACKEQKQKLADLQRLAVQPAAEVRQSAQTAAQEEAGKLGQAEGVKLTEADLQTVVSWLTPMPGTVRRSLKRPADLTGSTLPPGLVL